MAPTKRIDTAPLSALATCTLLVCTAAPAADRETKLLVLDIELVGDLGESSMQGEHAARIHKTSELLRQAVDRLPQYAIVGTAPVQEKIDTLSATQYLHKCNGCELDIATELHADQVLVAWIYRVSQLVLSLTYEIREVPSGRTVRRKAFDFRGDNDDAWSRTVTYMVKDLENSEPK